MNDKFELFLESSDVESLTPQDVARHLLLVAERLNAQKGWAGNWVHSIKDSAGNPIGKWVFTGGGSAL